jgi:hypothetical protein
MTVIPSGEETTEGGVEDTLQFGERLVGDQWSATSGRRHRLLHPSGRRRLCV